MTNTTETNRAKLLHMAAGGDGHITAWIERVTYDGAPADAQQYGYIVHVPQTAEHGGISHGVNVHMQDAAAARGLFHALQTGAKPRNPEDKAEDVAALCSSIPITDNGRHVPYNSR